MKFEFISVEWNGQVYLYLHAPELSFQPGVCEPDLANDLGDL